MSQVQIWGTIAFGALATAGFAALMWRGWHRRSARTADWVPEPPTVPVHLGESLTDPAVGLYLGTTTHGAWLERVTAHALGTRASATIHLHPAGVLIARGPVSDVFIPLPAITAVERVPAFAGKVLSGHGIVQVTWQAEGGAGPVDTGLRVRHREDHDRLLAALADLVPITDDKEQG